MSDNTPIRKSHYSGKPAISRITKVLVVLAVIISAAIIWFTVASVVQLKRGLQNTYDSAAQMAEYGDYEAAWKGWTSLGDWKDAPQRAVDVEIPMYYQLGVRYYAHGEYIGAIYYFSQCREYEDSMKYIEDAMWYYLCERSWDPVD